MLRGPRVCKERDLASALWKGLSRPDGHRHLRQPGRVSHIVLEWLTGNVAGVKAGPSLAMSLLLPPTTLVGPV